MDLDTGTVTRVDDEIKTFVPQINKLAHSLREAGGTVAWVTTPTFYRNYGDVRPCEDVIKLIEEN